MTKKVNSPPKSKPGSTAKAVTASSKTPQTKVPLKTLAKTPAKTLAKTAAKTPAKTSSKPTSKTPAKTPSKAPVKTAAKVTAKVPAKVQAKAPVKAPVKAAVKAPAAAPAKTLSKAPAKTPVKTAAKTLTKAPNQVAAKVPVKPQAAAKAPVKTSAKAPAKAPVKTPVKAAVKVVSKATPPAPAKVAAKSTAQVPAKAVLKAAPVVAPKPVPEAPKPSNHAVRPPATPPLKPSVQGPKVVAGQTIVQPQNKKSSRGAKAASMVPPPPLAVVSTNAAKSSFGPADAPSLPSVIPVIPKKDSKLANNWKTKPVAELTDAELIAMPDAEYMNDTQMAFFRLKLSQLKQEMLNNAGQTTENLREDTVVVPDPADRATIEEEHALELRTRDRERKLLKKIEQSIQRIDAGDYGYCDETGEAIGVGRLLARPTATLSLEAQQRRELKQKMFGD